MRGRESGMVEGKGTGRMEEIGEWEGRGRGGDELEEEERVHWGVG